MKRRRKGCQGPGLERGWKENQVVRFFVMLAAVLLFAGLFQAMPVRAENRERPVVQVCGNTVGIYMETDGVMVIDVSQIPTSDGLYADPSRNIIRAGDYICAVNGTALTGKRQLWRKGPEAGKTEVLKIREKGLPRFLIVFPTAQCRLFSAESCDRSLCPQRRFQHTGQIFPADKVGMVCGNSFDDGTQGFFLIIFLIVIEKCRAADGVVNTFLGALQYFLKG